MAISVSAVSVTTPEGGSKSLGDYAGKVLLIVNVASRCGFTKQYAGLQALNEAYAAKGLAVLGFPCNDFGAQGFAAAVRSGDGDGADADRHGETGMERRG